jgi:hypothetical protein
MKTKNLNLSVFVPMTLALAISQSLHAAPVQTSAVPVSQVVKNLGDEKSERRYNTVGYKIKRNKNGERLLDMTNSKHYKLAKDRLAKAGKSIEDYPQLHQSLNELKQQQIAAKSAAKLNSQNVVPDLSSQDVIENSHMFLDSQVAISPLDNKAYLIVRAESSVTGGTDATYIDLLLEDMNYNQIAPMGSTFQTLEGKQTHAVSSISLESLYAADPTLDRLYASSWVETEEADGSYTQGLRFTEYPWDWEEMIALYGPNMGLSASKMASKLAGKVGGANRGGRPVSVPVYNATHPVDVNTDGVIKVCLNRDHADCDYAADQYLDPNEITDVNIPFQGQITINHEITTIYSSDPNATQPNGIDEMTNIYLQEGVYGGVTKQTYLGLSGDEGFSEYLDFDVDATNKVTVISWDVPRSEGRFGNAKLFSNIAEADWRINLAVRGKPNFRGRTGNYQIQINSNNIAALNNYYVESLPKIKLGYSCLAKGTLITMADGSQKPIDQILKGDMVLGAMAKNGTATQAMTVVDTSIGIEALKMQRVTAADGSEILMTETHPVSTTNRGIIWSKELKKGDRILTEDGSVLITQIKNEKYNDNVYNLKLAPTAGSSIASGAYLGMYANGLLVGDLETQDEHNYKDQFIRESAEEKLMRMPSKWKADFISSLEEDSKTQF